MKFEKGQIHLRVEKSPNENEILKWKKEIVTNQALLLCTELFTLMPIAGNNDNLIDADWVAPTAGSYLMKIEIITTFSSILATTDAA